MSQQPVLGYKWDYKHPNVWRLVRDEATYSIEHEPSGYVLRVAYSWTMPSGETRRRGERLGVYKMLALASDAAHKHLRSLRPR